MAQRVRIKELRKTNFFKSQIVLLENICIVQYHRRERTLVISSVKLYDRAYGYYSLISIYCFCYHSVRHYAQKIFTCYRLYPGPLFLLLLLYVCVPLWSCEHSCTHSFFQPKGGSLTINSLNYLMKAKLMKVFISLPKPSQPALVTL